MTSFCYFWSLLLQVSQKTYHHSNILQSSQVQEEDRGCYICSLANQTGHVLGMKQTGCVDILVPHDNITEDTSSEVFCYQAL